MKLSQVEFEPFNRSLVPEDLKSLPRAARRLMEVLVKGSPTPAGTGSKSWALDSCLSPNRFVENLEIASRVGSTVFDVTRLASPFDPSSSIEATGETVTLPSDIVFRSVGYKSVPLPGFKDVGIRFDQRRGVISNDGFGRAMQIKKEDEPSQPLPGVYCAGWVKRGPTGVIATTMADAFVTGDAIAADWLSGSPFQGGLGDATRGGWSAVRDEADSSKGKAVAWNDWRKIDEAERERGQLNGKGREKFTTTADMLAVLG